MSVAAMSADVATVTADTFDQRVLHGRGPIVVEFMSYGCAHCRIMEPVLAQAASRLGGTEQVFRVNIGIEADLAERFDIRGTPTFVMFRDGEEIARIEGPQPRLTSLISAITQPFQALS